MNYENEIIAIYGACKTTEELKKAYISLIRKFHPDKGGSVEICKLVNTLYEQFANKLKNIHTAKAEKAEEPQKQDFSGISDKLKEVIFTLSTFPLDLEICGSWLWVTGRTWLYSKQLKACGCIFASRKKAWCFHETEWTPKKHKLNLDEIRDRHGSVKVTFANKRYNIRFDQISRG